jgi:hypothetical protein
VDTWLLFPIVLRAIHPSLLFWPISECYGSILLTKTGPHIIQMRYLLLVWLAQVLGSRKENFSERRLGEVRLCPGPMGQEFSGNCDVASRNALLHNGATNATRSRRSDSEEAPPCRTRVLGAELDGSLATLNFREFPFHAIG